MEISNNLSTYSGGNSPTWNGTIATSPYASGVKIGARANSVQFLPTVAVPRNNQQVSDFVNTDLLLNLAFSVLSKTNKRGGIIGWLQKNSGTIATAIQAYDFAKQVVPLATSGGALNVVGDTSLEIGTGVNSSLGKALGYAGQAYGAYKILSSDAEDDVKAQALAKQAGLFAADLYTAGLASVSYGFLSQSKIFRKIETALSKYDPIMHNVGSLGKLLGGSADGGDYLNLATGGMASVIGNVLGFDLGHKSTKEYQAERARGAFDAAITVADKAYVSNMYERKQQEASDNIIRNPSNPYFGQEWKWEEQKPLLSGEDVWGFMGFQEAFPDFISAYTEDQRRRIAQAALDENLLTPDKGNMLFSSSKTTSAGLTHLERIQQIAVEIKTERD